MGDSNKNSVLTSSRWTRLTWFFNLSFAIAFAMVALSVSKSRFRLAVETNPIDSFFLPQLSVLLLITSILLILAWMWAVYGEMQMLRDHGEEFVPTLPRETIIVGVSISAFLSLLAYFSYQPLVYSALYVGYKLTGIWAGKILESKLRQGFRNAKHGAEEFQSENWQLRVIERYYLETPHLLLALVETGLATVAVILASFGEYATTGSLKKGLELAAYIVMFAVIGLNAVVYARWRSRRDKELGENY